MQNFLPLPDGDYLCMPKSGADFATEVARHSTRDAERLPAWQSYIARGRRSAARAGAADSADRPAALAGPVAAAGAGDGDLRSLSLAQQRALYELFTRSAGELLDHWFESDAAQSAVRIRRDRRQLRQPLHPRQRLRAAASRLWRSQRPARHVGPCDRVAWARSRRRWPAPHAPHGARIETRCRGRARAWCEDGRAVGIELEGGRRIRARIVAANVNPKLLYLQLIEREHLPAEFLASMQRYRCGSASFRMNVALAELPRFSGRAPAAARRVLGQRPARITCARASSSPLHSLTWIAPSPRRA